eukprot:CAMPEP_0171780462 /NCGR_PEP_ID=MMETSP0991-20121206/59633_1 /TAXON_ID=483369 /ORGANISM="non described non described, Strain CCMP2098" /LENGTH=61 /DNA_ID=CAMNT_0012387855 /DNA_START=117 /DNA_END=299 /DNA_ORIENTATION=-
MTPSCRAHAAGIEGPIAARASASAARAMPWHVANSMARGAAPFPLSVHGGDTRFAVIAVAA